MDGPTDRHPTAPYTAALYRGANRLRDLADAMELRAEGNAAAWTDQHTLAVHATATQAAAAARTLTEVEVAVDTGATVVQLHAVPTGQSL